MSFPNMQRRGSIGSSRASGFLFESRSRKGSCADVINSTDISRVCYSCKGAKYNSFVLLLVK